MSQRIPHERRPSPKTGTSEPYDLITASSNLSPRDAVYHVIAYVAIRTTPMFPPVGQGCAGDGVPRVREAPAPKPSRIYKRLVSTDQPQEILKAENLCAEPRYASPDGMFQEITRPDRSSAEPSRATSYDVRVNHRRLGRCAECTNVRGEHGGVKREGRIAFRRRNTTCNNRQSHQENRKQHE